MDEAGRALLRRLAAAGCRLHASGVYNSYIVETLQSAVAKTRSPGALQTDGDGTRKR
jgi:hypothetical protein